MVCSGIRIAGISSMKVVMCERWLMPTTGKVYRVTSGEGEVILINMIVCDRCSGEAQILGFKTNEIDSATRRFLERG